MGGFKWREILLDSDSRSSSCPKLLRLPPELLSYIMSFLSGEDITNASRVCRAFYHANRIETVWQKRCLREYGVSLRHKYLGSSYMHFYTKLLHKYGKLVGLWQTSIASYGGLLQVKFEDGMLVGIEWHPPSDPNLCGPLRRKDLFSIEILPDGQAQILCRKGIGSHKCHIQLTDENSFYSKCCGADYHKHPGGKHKEFMEWLQEESSFVLDPHLKELSLMKFLMIREFENAFQHNRLEVPAHQPGAVIQPGLFKGTYSAHGLELVMLSYEEDVTRVKVVKVTGDPNVPASQVSFKADFRYPVILTESQQRNIEDLQKQPVSSPIPIDRLQPQSFLLPAECHCRDQEVPRSCKGRFYALGQIAGHGFTNPSFIGGHWIIFNEDLFGFLWFELLSLSLFHRVQEPMC